jgi:hypothetical protein
MCVAQSSQGDARRWLASFRTITSTLFMVVEERYASLGGKKRCVHNHFDSDNVRSTALTWFSFQNNQQASSLYQPTSTHWVRWLSGFKHTSARWSNTGILRPSNVPCGLSPLHSGAKAATADLDIDRDTSGKIYLCICSWPEDSNGRMDRDS